MKKGETKKTNETKQETKQEKQSANEKVTNILNKAKEKGKITYGELANELVDINAEEIDKVFDEFEKMGVDILKEDDLKKVGKIFKKYNIWQ